MDMSEHIKQFSSFIKTSSKNKNKISNFFEEDDDNEIVKQLVKTDPAYTHYVNKDGSNKAVKKPINEEYEEVNSEDQFDAFR